MATRTSYLNLIKPNYTDAADIADINANMDTLDDKIKKIDSAAIDDTLVPTSDSGTIRNQLSQLANRIKAATGTVGWKDDPSTTLASLATLVSNLASGSDVTWDGKKFTNTKLGISGLMDTNGYVSFGKNFGGLIIQWGITGTNGDNDSITFPIAAKAKALFTSDLNGGDITSIDYPYVVTILTKSLTNSSVSYIVYKAGIGSFYWFGIFAN